jgi:uncharacterized protein YcnI
MKRAILAGALTVLATLFVPAIAYAHVTVTPGQADVAQELVFNVSAPNEKLVPVTSIKLLIPSGVSNVIPTSKDGWTITTTTNGDNANPEITTINWSGTIPVGQRQDFSFSAQVPGQATELDWKAYQTYADGSVVHWDQKPAGTDDATGDAGPYSVTKVIDDLTVSNSSTGPNIDFGLVGSYAVAGIALVVAAAALALKRR